MNSPNSPYHTTTATQAHKTANGNSHHETTAFNAGCLPRHNRSDRRAFDPPNDIGADTTILAELLPPTSTSSVGPPP